MSRRLIVFAVAMSLTCAVRGQDKAAGHKPASSEGGAQAEQADGAGDDFVIGAPDVLSVVVWKEPDLSAKVVVRPDGKISLPLVGEIQASGMTALQLQAAIQEKLKNFVAAPNVSVVVSEIKSQLVFIMGEVGSPGPYALSSPMRVLELLARAGGVRDLAKKSRIQIVRRLGDKTLQLRFNYDDFVSGKDLEQNIYLRNGDVVIVP